MGISFMTSRNMDGETTGSHSLGSNGSTPLSMTFLSSSHRLKDSRGGSMPGSDTWTAPSDLREIRSSVARWTFSYLLSGGTARGSVASAWLPAALAAAQSQGAAAGDWPVSAL